MIEPKRASERSDRMSSEFLESVRRNYESGFYVQHGMSSHVQLRLLQHIAYLTEQVREGQRFRDAVEVLHDSKREFEISCDECGVSVIVYDLSGCQIGACSGSTFIEAIEQLR